MTLNLVFPIVFTRYLPFYYSFFNTIIFTEWYQTKKDAMSSAVVKHPLVLWAQRSPHLYLAVEVEDMNIEELTIEEDKFKIKGKKGNDKYEADLQFFGKVNGTELRKIATDRRVEFVIPKEKEEWWPRLLKEKTKVAWIKVDFDKWKDEDEEKEDDGGGAGAPFGGMDFSSFGMPSGGKGFDDLDMDDEGENLDDMGDLEDVDDDELNDSPSKKPDQNGEGIDPVAGEKGANVEISTSTGKE